MKHPILKGVGKTVLMCLAIFLGASLITLGIIIWMAHGGLLSISIFGYFFAPFIMLAVLIVGIILYWLTCLVIHIVKRIINHHKQRQTVSA